MQALDVLKYIEYALHSEYLRATIYYLRVQILAYFFYSGFSRYKFSDFAITCSI